MARRTTPAAVRSISNIPSSVDLYGFIDTANEMTNRVETAGETSDVRLELIERWLAAHLAASTVDPIITKKQIDLTAVTYGRGEMGANLHSTPYGRQALALDRTWTLEKEYGTLVDSIWIGDDDPNGPNPA